MSTYNLGRILPIFKGSYDTGTTYKKLDLVYVAGSGTFVAKEVVVGENPETSDKWQVICKDISNSEVRTLFDSDEENRNQLVQQMIADAQIDIEEMIESNNIKVNNAVATIQPAINDMQDDVDVLKNTFTNQVNNLITETTNSFNNAEQNRENKINTKISEIESEETVYENGLKEDLDTFISEKNGEIGSKLNEFTTTFNSNEEDRTNTFNTNEADRTTAFNTNETNRTNTFNQSESDRAATFAETEAQREADIQIISEEAELLRSKANVDGYYEEMSVGLAENLISPDGKTDSTPYLFRPTANDNSIDSGYAEIQSLKGNSLVWNQLINNVYKNSTLLPSQYYSENYSNGVYTLTANVTEEQNRGRWLIYSNTYTKLTVNHKYIIISNVIQCTGFTFNSSFYFCGKGYESGTVPTSGYSYCTYTSSNSNCNFIFLQNSGTNSVTVSPNATFQFSVNYIDLTKMYGAGNEPTTVEQFKADFPASYYEYNAGEIINVEPNGLKTVGFNQAFNEIIDTTSKNTFASVNAYLLPKTYNISLENYTACTIYLKFFDPITKEAINADEVDFTGINNWKTNKNNEWKYCSLNTDNTLQFTVGKPYYVSVKTSVESLYGTNVCINLSWSGYRNGEYEEYNEHNISLPVKSIKDSDGNYLFPDGLRSAGSVYDEITSKKAIKRCEVRTYQSGDEDDSTVITDGTNTIYSLATPIEVDFEETPQDFGTTLPLVYKVDDWGTEEYTTDSTGIVAPVAHETLYMTNLRDKIRTIDGNTDDGALMNDSLTNLLATLSTALGGTLTKTWNTTNSNWDFSFTANTTNNE